MYIYIYTYVHTHTHTYIYIYRHVYVYIYIYIDRPILAKGLSNHCESEYMTSKITSKFAGESRKQVGSPSAHPGGGWGLTHGVWGPGTMKRKWGTGDVSQTVFYGIGTLNPSFYYRWSLVLANRFGHDEWVLVSRFLIMSIMSYFSSSKNTLILLAFPAFPGFPYFCRAHQRKNYSLAISGT